MLTELACCKRVVGAKQVRKAVETGRAKRVYLACDADPAIIGPVEARCRETGVPAECGATMAQLGKACGLAVGASVVAILTQ